MILAVKRMESIGWIALVFLVAILLYPLSLRVASVRNDLVRVERQIVAVKKNLRYLETEFSARASLRQLETWNALEYGYVSPTSDQYIDGERALANLGKKNLRSPVRVAVTTLPDGVAPAGIIGTPFGDWKPVADKIAQDGSGLVSKEQPQAQPQKIAVASSKEQQIAQLDSRLLSDKLLKTINLTAAIEAAGEGE